MDRAPRRPAFPSRRSTHRAGISLVEVLVALTIVGVAAGLSLPRINDIANQNRVHRAAQSLQIEVQQAFALAGRNRAPVAIRWNSASAQLELTNLKGTTVFRRAGLRDFGLKADEVAVTPTMLAVFPNGIAADSLVIRVARREFTRTVHVSRAGMVRVK